MRRYGRHGVRGSRWRFLPKWDAYIGTFFSQLNGGLDNGYLSRNNLATTAGVRFRF